MTGEKKKKNLWWSRFRITIEPIVAAVVITATLSGPLQTDLVFRQSCKMYDLTRELCSLDEQVDDEVHRIAANFVMYSTILATLPGCLISLFTSPWSDTNGRKPWMLASLFGMALSQALLAGLSCIEDIHPYALLLCHLPGVSGGTIVALLSCACYLVDVTIPEDRSLRFSVMVAAIVGSPIVGSAVSPSLAGFGYQSGFGVTALLLFLTFLYACFLLPESVEIDEDKRTNLLTFKHLVESFRAYLKKRPNKTRGIVFAITLLSCSSVASTTGERNVKYQALMKVFHWTITEFSNFNVVLTAVIVVCTFGGVYVGNTLLGINEAKLMFFITLIGSTASFLMTWAPSSLYFYIFNLLGVFSSCIGALSRGLVTRIVDPSDVVKVIAFMNILDAFSPEFGAMVYASLYSATVASFPFAVFLLSCGIEAFACCCAAVTMYLLRSTRNQDYLVESGNT